MSKQKWEFTEHSEALADTGDYDYYIRFTNGKDVLQSSGCELEDNQLQEFCNLLDAMPDLWSHKLDATEFENSQFKKQIENLRSALESSLQMLEQTLAYRNANGIQFGNVFLECTIDQVKEALSNAAN